VELTQKMRAEIARLAKRYGEPVRVDAVIDDGFFDPIRRPDRIGEVCMVIRRPNGKLLLSIKTFYPRGAHRLPTGGIADGEAIYDALVRETEEETGLETEVRRFLAAISYRSRSSPDGSPLFHTFAFLLDELAGTLAPKDDTEQIEEYIEVAPADVGAVAARLESIAPEQSDRIAGDWASWGRFRAIVHRVVADALLGQ
jgi:ADP-ribose pyrophosphatase YjhB (NUDIX family)